MKIKWFPNSWIEIKIGEKVICFDPAYLRTYFKDYNDKTEFSKWPDAIDGLPNGLATADLVLITHHHKDHCKKVTLNRVINANTKIFAPKSCRKELGNGFQLIRPGDIIKEDWFDLKVVNSYNTQTGSSTRKQHKKGVGVGYVLRIKGASIYNSGDSDLITDMYELGDIDIAFLPIGGKFTMDFEEAIDVAKIINPKIVIPIHHLKSNPIAFENLMNSYTHINCIIPQIGKEFEIN